MYYLIDYYTDEIIDVFSDPETATETCKNTPDSQVETENDDIIYTNIIE